MTEFDKALEQALKSSTLDEVERNGKLLSNKTIFGSGYKITAYLYEYNNQKYVIENKHYTTYPFDKSECLRFGVV